MRMKKLLTELREGETGEVIRIYGGSGLQERLAVLGIRIGKNVTMVASQPFHGPVVLKVDGNHVAIGHGMAWKILVEVKG
ncbi:MAG: FeoA family protein [Candidatus Hadarchaeales archaeon]